MEARERAEVDSSWWCFVVGEVKRVYWLAQSAERHSKHGWFDFGSVSICKKRLYVVNKLMCLDYLDNLM